MRPLILALVRNFCAAERFKLRRYLIDRLRCECDLRPDEAEAEVAALEAEGLIHPIEISHYDPASEDVTVEAAVIAGRRLFDEDALLIAG